MEKSKFSCIWLDDEECPWMEEFDRNYGHKYVEKEDIKYWHDFQENFCKYCLFAKAVALLKEIKQGVSSCK